MPTETSNLSYDLKLGIEKFVAHIPHQKGIDSILKWMVGNIDHIKNKSSSRTSSDPGYK